MQLCARCHQIQKTCCQGTSIILSQGDVRRITQATGNNDFYRLEYHPDLSYLATYAYDPNWEKYVVLPGGRMRQLKMDERSRDCIFLGNQGCVLASDIRPLMCRLYPYTYNEFGMIGLVLNEDLICPLHALQAGETVLDMLALPHTQADPWRKMYYAELRSEYLERVAGSQQVCTG